MSFGAELQPIFNDYLTDNLEDTHLTNKNFTNATSKLHELFITNEYRSDIISVFNVEKWSNGLMLTLVKKVLQRSYCFIYMNCSWWK